MDLPHIAFAIWGKLHSADGREIFRRLEALFCSAPWWNARKSNDKPAENGLPAGYVFL